MATIKNPLNTRPLLVFMLLISTLFASPVFAANSHDATTPDSRYFIGGYDVVS